MLTPHRTVRLSRLYGAFLVAALGLLFVVPSVEGTTCTTNQYLSETIVSRLEHSMVQSTLPANLTAGFPASTTSPRAVFRHQWPDNTDSSAPSVKFMPL